MKKTHVKLILMLVLMICIFVLPQCVNAATYKDDAGNTYTYSISNNEATITDFSGGGDAVIPETLGGYPVTCIGSSAFSKCASLASVTIPDSVTSIGDYAFYKCASLTSVTIPDSVTSIGYYSFFGCASLTGVIMTDNVISVDEYAFASCSGLKSVVISSSMTKIENNTFRGCSELASITIPNSIISIGDSAFESCTSLVNITIPDSVTTIGESVFSGCTALSSVIISNGMTSVGKKMFMNCGKLTRVLMPNNIKRIESYAFNNCRSLKDITIPDSVTCIENYAFYGCTALNRIMIPNSVINIGNGVFKGCSALAEITLPFIGATRGNTGTADAVFGYIFGYTESEYQATDNDTVQYYGSGKNYYHIPKSISKVTITDETVIGYGAFENCSWITSISILEGVNRIEGSAFSGCKELESIIIPNSVTYIGGYAFHNCYKLNDIIVPNSVVSIGKYAFIGCSSLREITLPFIGSQRGNSGTENSVFVYIFGERSHIPETLKKVTITDETVVSYRAFYNCSSLTDIVLTDGVTSIEEDAFYNCSGLTRITVPNSVISIGNNAFRRCSSLEEITLPFIGSQRGNSGTEDAVFGYIFGYTGLETEDGTIPQCFTENVCKYYYIPNTLKKVIITDETMVGYGAFYGCSNMSDVVILGDVKAIASNAFANHFNFLNVVVADKDVKFGNSVFYNTDFATLYGYANSASEVYANDNNIEFELLADVGNCEIDGYIEYSAETIAVNINVSRMVSGKRLNVMMYDENDILLDYVVKEDYIPYNDKKISFSDNPGASYVKVFLWDSLIQGVPLTTAKRINIDR
ncbi:MAG: leucine-rich repeat domain-containing protein [Clostridia bacterium]|nr:leucine-rich repeat domain-containing protein [Clostridia bacterium]